MTVQLPTLFREGAAWPQELREYLKKIKNKEWALPDSNEKYFQSISCIQKAAAVQEDTDRLLIVEAIDALTEAKSSAKSMFVPHLSKYAMCHDKPYSCFAAVESLCGFLKTGSQERGELLAAIKAAVFRGRSKGIQLSLINTVSNLVEHRGDLAGDFLEYAKLMVLHKDPTICCAGHSLAAVISIKKPELASHFIGRAFFVANAREEKENEQVQKGVLSFAGGLARYGGQNEQAGFELLRILLLRRRKRNDALHYSGQVELVHTIKLCANPDIAVQSLELSRVLLPFGNKSAKEEAQRAEQAYQRRFNGDLLGGAPVVADAASAFRTTGRPSAESLRLNSIALGYGAYCE